MLVKLFHSAKNWPLSVYISIVLILSGDTGSCHYNSCNLPGPQGTFGRCVPINNCPSAYASLVSLQFEPNPSFGRYLEERTCGYGPHGVHICCASESYNSERMIAHRKPQARRSCRTFRQGPGNCVPIETCPSIYNCSVELQRNYNPTLHLHLTQSFCYQEKGKIFVCCDDDQSVDLKPVKKLGWQSCETPFLDAGKCVPPSRCGLIENSDNLPDLYKAFMVGCEQPNGVRHMCCPQNEIQYDTEYGKQCKTKDMNAGHCVETERCDDFLKSADRQEYVRNNWCYSNLEQVEYVCCTEAKILTAPEKPIEIGSRAGEDAPTCTTPNSTPGRCVALAQCSPIISILREASAAKKAVSAVQAAFLKTSVCTPGNTAPSSYYVCCDEGALQTVTTPTPVVTMPTTTASIDIANHPNLRLLDRVNCGKATLGDKISFGTQASMYQYPWMALLIYRSSSGQEGPECGGTVINTRYVLTAAHCIDGQIERLVYVRLGEYDTRTDPDCDEYMDCAPPFTRYGVEEYTIHPNFTRMVRSGNDIGLLRLNRNVQFNNDDIMPICLPFSNSLVRFDPSLYWITGWGLTERLESSPVLQQARIPSVACSLSTHSICAGFGNGTLHCRGDSGGPMKVPIPDIKFRYVQYGIISAGPGCGVSGTPGVSTRVTFFMRWILDNIRE
ncbi:CLIP domain-containing serine protease B9-like isoform X2 [Malaya genurostris]|uniref:CLIP domain-containing serine protease B9-like isoform X2 n=1 Tax=Malaya genurostris TaxID=325434 RepID=UPI0026F3A0A0|nr:CLIP domain-containing serine protease B9-like isoform X2 [Malaya genurostris]